MQTKKEKIILSVLSAIVILGGFEVLIYILNLNEPRIFIAIAWALYAYLVFKIAFFYDLHFKPLPPGKKSAIREIEMVVSEYESVFLMRIKHLWDLKQVGKLFNYLLIPTLIFWSVVISLYVNFGQVRIQQSIALLSGFALISAYWYIREIFSSHLETVNNNIFIRMSVIKIYTAALTFGAIMAIMRSYCLPPWMYAALIFSVTFSLIFQALFQHRLNSPRNLLLNAVISLVQAAAGYFVYTYWGLNYYTGAIVLTILYNLMWGTFHYHLDHALTKKAFLEILIFSLLLAFMIFGSTNFKSKILDGCIY